VSEPILRVERSGSVARVTLNRPEVRNAFNAELIAALDAAFGELGQAENVRAIVLDGAGKTFCGGADVNWMRGSLELSEAENVRDAERMSTMFRTLDRCPKPVVARVHGAALGGGAGLCAVCDIVVSTPDAVYGFTETKLGILPAVISPFVIAKIGVSNARALFLTGQRFDALRAERIGLVHEIVAEGALDQRVAQVVAEFKTAGPQATAAAKRLIADVRETRYDESQALTARAIARQRTSPEGQEGLRAFLERRSAGWTES
jgi:methylglutaconyl-CoA hydratase